MHAHPEIGFEEARTCALVADKLRTWGIDEVHSGIGKTGVVGIVRGRTAGPTVGLRADMDALPMQEQTGLDFASRIDGVFHGCGHDGHTTMLLGAARYLAATRNFPGKVVLIFQPAEEGLGGATAMIKDGLFSRFPCDEIYGLHNWPGAELGWVGTTPGPAMAASSNFDIEISGRGAHGAMPEQSVDPVMVAVSVAQVLQTIVSRNVPPLDAAVISITQIHAGTAYNVIPDTAVLRGTIRAFSKATIDLITQRMRDLALGVATGFGASALVEVREVFRALVNAPAQTAEACRIASGLVGAANVDANAKPLTGSEDFADMLDFVPGAYLWLGQGPGASLHNPAYRFNDDLIPVGATLYARLAEERLSALDAEAREV
ncbi:MAG: M20 aminoacylase family protein [Aestuariivirga sp.]